MKSRHDPYYRWLLKSGVLRARRLQGYRDYVKRSLSAWFTAELDKRLFESLRIK